MRTYTHTRCVCDGWIDGWTDICHHAYSRLGIDIPEDAFDSNAITPGTPFMTELTEVRVCVCPMSLGPYASDEE